MNTVKPMGPLIVLFTVFTLMMSVFVVNMTEQALVLQFGELKHVHNEPGLKFRIPLIQDVIFYEKRVLAYDLPTIDAYTLENKKIMVDAYVRYRIKDPVQFYKALTPATEEGAKARLADFVRSAVLDIIGKAKLSNLLSDQRSAIMLKIQEDVDQKAKRIGLDIVDVRIIRTELQPGNRASVFDRMNSDLIRFAKENRAKGEEEALGIRARADTQRTMILAKAEEEARTLRGKADGEVIQITNSAFSKDIGLYQMLKSLEAYQKVFKPDTNVVLSTNSDFFNLIKKQPES
ncbi:MAG: protease modulator HflC [Alphaproteobacteria bacterium]|nr:protease modulator HflC [Alphaproteobacteria bacterium]